MRFFQKYNFISIFLSFCLFVLPFITSRHLFYGAVNAKLFFVYFFTDIIFLIFAYNLISKRHILSLNKRWLLGSVIFVLFSQYLSAFLGVYPERSFWSDIIRGTGLFFITHMALLAFCVGEVLKEDDWKLVRRSIAISTGVFSFITFFASSGLGFSGRFLSINLEINGLTFGNDTFAASYILIGFIITIIEFLKSEQKSKTRLFFGFLLFIQFFSPLFINLKIASNFSGFDFFDILGSARASGATIIIVIVNLIGLFVIKKFTKNRYKKYVAPLWGGIFILGIISVITLLFIPGSFLQKKYIEESTSARILVWQSSLEAVKERPILGYGQGNFRIAFQKHFNSNLYLSENIGEIWFDRAHNIIVDTLVSVGFLGIISVLLSILIILVLVKNVVRNNIIGESEGYLLIVIIFAHFLQLQTSFDTVGTYTLVALILGYFIYLEKEYIKSNSELKSESNLLPLKTKENINKLFGLLIIILTLISLKAFVFDEYVRQKSLLSLFTTTDDSIRVSIINKVLSRQSDFESLRLSSSSLIKGALEEMSKNNNPNLVKSLVTQLDIYARYFEKYLASTPIDYRARTNYAYILMLKTVFGDNKIAEAKSIIADSYKIVPGHPINYILDSMASLYSGDIKGAKEIIGKATTIYPNLLVIKNVSSFIEKQEKQFPTISVIRLENL